MQNKMINFECVDNKVHIYVSNEDYSVGFLDDEEETRSVLDKLVKDAEKE